MKWKTRRNRVLENELKMYAGKMYTNRILSHTESVNSIDTDSCEVRMKSLRRVIEYVHTDICVYLKTPKQRKLYFLPFDRIYF